jgi:hypothetical protein
MRWQSKNDDEIMYSHRASFLIVYSSFTMPSPLLPLLLLSRPRPSPLTPPLTPPRKNHYDMAALHYP